MPSPSHAWAALECTSGFLVAMLVASQLGFVSSVFAESKDALAIITGGTLIFLVGVVDDIWGLDSLTKAAGQIIAAGVMAFQGVQLLWLPFNGVTVLDYNTSIIITVLLVVVTVNAINFVDGLDGLAAGIIGIGSLAFFAFSYLLSVEEGIDRAATATLITAILAGMCAGFLPHNFNPARIFMGDSGSMLSGTASLRQRHYLGGEAGPVRGRRHRPSWRRSFPCCCRSRCWPSRWSTYFWQLFDEPVLDAHRLRRTSNTCTIGCLEIGHTQRQAVLVMYMWAAALAVGSTVAVFVNTRVGLIVALAIGRRLCCFTRRPRKVAR